MNKNNYSDPEWSRKTDSFWARVSKSRDGCWEWTGAKNKYGYGVICAHRDGAVLRKMAHRFSYELSVGAIPAGLLVCHKCDNRSCVRPSHLFIGSHFDNTADMMAKGRHVKGMTHLRKIGVDGKYPKGEAHKWSKLKAKQVVRIRALGQTIPAARIAKKFGVTTSLISLILRRKIWRCVP